MVARVIVVTIGILVAGIGIYITSKKGEIIPENIDELKQLIHDILPFELSWLKVKLESSNDNTNSMGQTFRLRKTHSRIFTKKELGGYDGTEGSSGLYLAIMGHVFNVEEGRKHYGPGGGYQFFSGRDGTKAFISGDFTEKGLIEDTSELTPVDMLGIKEWLEFYEKDYKFVGLLEGLYYDGNGQATPALLDAERRINLGLKLKKSEAEEKKEFPPCNSQWTKKAGGRVWCTKKSGGINRDWIGVPRKLYKAGSTDYRCACVQKNQLNNPLLKEYEDCDPNSESCRNKKTQ